MCQHQGCIHRAYAASRGVGYLYLPSQTLKKRPTVLCMLVEKESKIKKYESPLGYAGTIYFLIKCIVAILSHKPRPAGELTLTNVCCYQNGEELQEVNVPCNV